MAYEPPEGYLDVMRAPTREVNMVLSAGSNIDQEAAEDVTAITAETLPLSNPAQLTDAIYELSARLAVFEGYGIPTTGTVIAPPLSAQAYPPEAGVWSDVISDRNGELEWSFAISLSESHTSGFTVYCRDMQIAEASIVFKLAGAVVASGEMELRNGTASWTDAETYDYIAVTITRINQAYTHIKVTEVEFGASVAYDRKSLTGTVHIIEEHDPLGVSTPLCELDFSLLNVSGKFDPDHPTSGAYAGLAPGTPIIAGLEVQMGRGFATIPMGRYVVYERTAADVNLNVVCYDSRMALRDNHDPWTMNSTESLGVQISALLTSLSIPHVIEEGTMEIVPVAGYTFSGAEDLLTAMLYIQQRYGVYLVPERDGYLHVTDAPPSGDYGDMDMDMQYSWPMPRGYEPYNYIQVAYAGGYATVDLRAKSDITINKLVVNNPLVTARADAEALAQEISDRAWDSMTETEWRTDATTDLGDAVGIFGRWDQENAVEYTVTRQDTAYDGGLKATMQGVRRSAP